MNFGEKLKEARVNSGLSIKKAASEAGIKAAYLFAYEEGEFRPTIDDLHKLVDVYDDESLIDEFYKRPHKYDVSIAAEIELSNKLYSQLKDLGWDVVREKTTYGPDILISDRETGKTFVVEVKSTDGNKALERVVGLAKDDPSFIEDLVEYEAKEKPAKDEE